MRMKDLKLKLRTGINRTIDKESNINIILLNKNGTKKDFNVNTRKKTWSHGKREYLLSPSKRFFDGDKVYYLFAEEKTEALPAFAEEALDSTEFYSAINNKVVDKLNLIDKPDTIKATLILVFIILMMVGLTLYYVHAMYTETVYLSEYLQMITNR